MEKYEIDEMLSSQRPDRYDPIDDGWLDPIIGLVAMNLPAREARDIAATQIVKTRESRATRKANAMIRDVMSAEGQVPLDWFEALRLPIAVGKERVRLGAATASDLRTFAAEERRVAANDFSTRNATCEGAEALADRVEAAGASSVEGLHLFAPSSEVAAS